jgi:hypothetical protein
LGLIGCEFCGYEFPENSGRFGCPNCEGEPLPEARMGVKRSNEMKAALDLVRQGMSAYAAAKETGITSGNLYKSAEYRAIIAARSTAKPAQ